MSNNTYMQGLDTGPFNTLVANDIGFDPYGMDYPFDSDLFDLSNGYFTSSNSDNGSGFQDFLKLGLNAFGSTGSDPKQVSQQAGNQLAYNLGQSASTAAMVGQGVGIKGQSMGAGTGFLGEDLQVNREANAILRGQQLNQTNLARENNAQGFKTRLAGSRSPISIARLSAMTYGV